MNAVAKPQARQVSVAVSLMAVAAGAALGFAEAGIPVLLVSALLVGAAQQSLP